MRRDAIVIGAGAAARTAAIEASRCGLRVLLVAGGEAALRRAEAALRLERIRIALELACASSRHGPEDDGSESRLLVRRPEVDDLPGVAMRDELSRLGSRDARLEIDFGDVEFASPNTVRLADGSTCEAPIVVIAVEGWPRRPARFPFDDRLVCDAESVWLRGALPRRAVVLGADAEGCALACLLGALSVPVTVVDRRSQSLRYLDRDVLEAFHASLRELGVDLVLSEDIDDAVVDGGAGVRVALASGRVELCDALVVVGGRESGTAALRLDRAGIETDPRGFVLADDRGRTSQAGVFAAGRAVSEVGPYADEYFGRRVVWSALGLADDGAGAVPLVVGSIPEIAMVGLTADMCRQLDVPHLECAVDLGRDSASAATRSCTGLLKLVVQRRAKTLLGVQLMGLAAREAVQLGSLLVARERSVRELLGLTASDDSVYAAYARAACDVLRRAQTLEESCP